ncbi:helix-turn-helix domain-containing protein [Streptomyces netropsis]|uniref:helix-turn-helix domain-containing protein n=1 Tax=Streptomyces netropsis TaxID=55404 RepID=UPI003BB5877D
MKGQFLGVSEAAVYLGMSKRWIYRESLRHGIPRYHFGGRVKFKVADLDKWVRQQKVG